MSITEYLNSLLDNNKDLEEEVNDLFNNLISGECSTTFTIKSKYSIVGPSNILNILDYTYLIPNLFRKCYLQNNINIPNICVSYVYNTTITKYLPYLLEEKYIKSFLYFNFPASYKNYNNINNYIQNIVNFKNYISVKARNTTYGSYTTGQVIYNSLYNNNSMLSQLLQFNSYLYLNNYSFTQEKVITPYIVNWDYTTGCITNKNNQTFTVLTYNNNEIINQSISNNLNYIRYSFFNIFIPPDDIHYNEILLLYKSNIFLILDYALSVYQDIVQKIDYYLKDAYYCDKDYMNIDNIPILLELYQNFYKNQIYTVNNQLPTSSVTSIVPDYITIQQYITNFTTYYTNNNLGSIINTVILNNTEGFVFCYTGNIPLDSSTIIRSNYSYYYINIYNPSAVQLNNYWGLIGPTPNYTGLTVNDFSNDFLYNGTIIGTHQPYLKISNSVSALLQFTYINGGLYPLTTPLSTVSGLVYYTYNDVSQTSINSKVYLTFETELGNPIGLPLVYYPL